MSGEYQVPEEILGACFLVSGVSAFCFKMLIAGTKDAKEYTGNNLTGKKERFLLQLKSVNFKSS